MVRATWCGNNTYRTIVTNVKRYWEIRKCETCGNKFLADKYNNVRYCSTTCKGSSVGRPIGTVLSNDTKHNISKSRNGYKHSSSTKLKISEKVKIGLKNSSLSNIKHNETNSTLWKKWISIKQRCYNPNNKNHKYYHDKGIKVCEEWHNYINFRDWCLKNGYKPYYTLERLDKSGDYEPNNCIIKKQQ